MIDTLQAAVDENPENKQARMMLKAFRYAANHPDEDDLRNLRQFLQEHSI